MLPKKSKSAKKANAGANVGYEAELWKMADALLPQLISGELSIPDAEKMLERVE